MKGCVNCAGISDEKKKKTQEVEKTKGGNLSGHVFPVNPIPEATTGGPTVGNRLDGQAVAHRLQLVHSSRPDCKVGH